jgi:hypothetical protein
VGGGTWAPRWLPEQSFRMPGWSEIKRPHGQILNIHGVDDETAVLCSVRVDLRNFYEVDGQSAETDDTL